MARHFAVRIGVEVELGAERPARQLEQRRIGQRTDAAAATENLDAHAQTVQRLADFESDHTGPEDRDAFRQRRPLKHVVVDDHPVAERIPCRRMRRRRSGGDDDARRADGQRVADLQCVVVDEPGVATNLVGRRKRFDVVDDKSGETVSLALDAIHHRLAVDGDRARRLDAERRETRESVRGFRRRDQQLARHASDARAGRAVGAALDQQRALPGRLDRPVCGKPRGAGTDDGDVGVKDLHVHVSSPTKSRL